MCVCAQVLAWDCDEKEPVMSLQDSHEALKVAALSSSGRFLAVAGEECLVSDRTYTYVNIY